MATLTGQTISSTYKSLLKATSAVPALSSGSSSTERLVFGEDDNADVRTAMNNLFKLCPDAKRIIRCAPKEMFADFPN